ncbi:MAG: mcpB 2 [Firmicutes bacterium]|nr:mcpB 2 [Bacillota bacterium]
MFKRVIRSMFAKISLVAIICMVIPMIVSTFFASIYSASIIESKITNSLTSTANEKKNQLEVAFKELADITQSNANDSYIVDFLQETALTNQIDKAKMARISNNLTKKFNNANGLYENIFISCNGEIFIDGTGGKSVGHKNSDEPWFNPVMSSLNHNSYIADPIVSPITGMPDIVIACPIVDDRTERILGIFVLPIELNTLTKSIVADNSAMQQNTLLMTSSGLVASSGDSSKILTLDFSKAEGDLNQFFSLIKSNNSGIGSFTLDGQKCIAAYIKSDRLNMYIVTYMPITQYMADINEQKYIMLLIMIVSIIIAGLVITLFCYRLTKPLAKLEWVASRIADGDLSITQIEVTTKDELGRLARVFELMVQNLRELTRHISGSSEQIAASSEQLTASADQAAQAASHVADATNETTLGVERQVKVADNTLSVMQNVTAEAKKEAVETRNAVDIAISAVVAASEGNKTVTTAITQMDNIRQTVDNSSVVIAELGEQSKEIGKIVETISGIASQTNLLALNAAIEAARAGEQGRGFAVVAEEVRNLAEQSQAAAKQITELISNIQQKTNEAVNVMSSGTQEVRRGTEVVDKARQSFMDIERHVKKVAEISEGVANSLSQLEVSSQAALEQVKESEHINKDIAGQSQSISAATEEQSASMQEIAASSQHLSNLAEKLQEAVAKFKL